MSGRIQHDIATGVVFRERDTVTDRIEAGKQRDPTVQTVSQTTVRRRTIFEGIHQEAETLLCLFFGEAQQLEHLILQLAVVDTDGTATHFDTIDHHVVCIRTDGSRIAVQQRNIFGFGRS